MIKGKEPERTSNSSSKTTNEVSDNKMVRDREEMKVSSKTKNVRAKSKPAQKKKGIDPVARAQIDELKQKILQMEEANNILKAVYNNIKV